MHIKQPIEFDLRLFLSLSQSLSYPGPPFPLASGSIALNKWKPKTSILFVGIFWFLHTVYLFTEPAVWLKGLVVLCNVDTCVVMNHGINAWLLSSRQQGIVCTYLIQESVAVFPQDLFSSPRIFNTMTREYFFHAFPC